ncbi:MAG: hypothetical protein U0414_10655 [Polyangiaceae bacterium]
MGSGATDDDDVDLAATAALPSARAPVSAHAPSVTPPPPTTEPSSAPRRRTSSAREAGAPAFYQAMMVMTGINVGRDADPAWPAVAPRRDRPHRSGVGGGPARRDPPDA